MAAASVVEAEQIQESDGLQERIKEATDKDEVMITAVVAPVSVALVDNTFTK